MNIPDDPSFALACIADLAAQGFTSIAAAMDVILPAMTDHFPCQASLVVRVDEINTHQINVIAVHHRAGIGALAPESTIMPTADEWAFWLGETNSVTPLTAPLTGYAVGTPICLADGTCWGLLVALDMARTTWTPTHAFVMRVLARRLADEIAHQQQREHAIALKADFVAIVSHEFRTALMSILGFSQMLCDEACSAAETHEFATDIFNDATRINRMITDMLDLDRMESGRIKLTKTTVDLNHFLRDITTRYATTLATHTLRLQLDPALPCVSADSDKIIQIITNLLNNAIKYSPQGGEIVLGSTSDAEVAHLWVSDQGMGIPTDALEHIFERYARVEAETSRYIQGTGLGLPIVRQLAQMHGGHAWAASKLGTGSTFHVTLPLTQTSAHTT